MTFKKAEMAKTLKNGLIMIEMNPLNHNWSHFVILSGLSLHQLPKNQLLSVRLWLCLSQKNLIKLQLCITTANCPGFFDSDIT